MVKSNFEAARDPVAEKVKVAAIQLNSQDEPVANRAAATVLIRAAAAAGARFISTPEYTNILRHNNADVLAATQPDDGGNDDINHYGALARDLGLWLNIGSLAVKISDDKIANRSFLFNPQGEVAARYDKIHLFDVDLPDGKVFRESDGIRAGDRAVVADTPFGRVGMNICYDIRFPEQQKAQAIEGGATILTVPAAYSVASGKRTWETFLRARAAETGCYVVAAAQCGSYEDGADACWGHSMVVSPFGEIVATAAEPNAPGFVLADLDPALVTAARFAYPVQAQTAKAIFTVENVGATSAVIVKAATPS